MSLSVVILAAGRGTRMRSAHPKVLQPLAGRPMLAHVLDTARALAPSGIHVVVGHGAEAVMRECAGDDITWVAQRRQLGTGHAVLQALPGIPDGDTVLVLYGDVPLVSAATAEALARAGRDAAALLSVHLPDPSGYGRVRRAADGSLLGIVEEKDADPRDKGIKEVNTGLLAAPVSMLRKYLGRIGNDNHQGEYYLPDIIGLAVADRAPVAVLSGEADELAGINDRRQLALAERLYQSRQAQALMDVGVTITDPARLDVRGRVVCGVDVVLEPGVVLEGDVHLEAGVRVGAYCVLKDCHLGEGTEVLPFSHLEGARTGRGTRIGPYARVRPGTVLGDDVRIGNFVEVKASSIDEGSKVNHLTYIGDARIGRKVNVGAGTVTCNYDGVDKHRTVIEDEAFIGSGTMLVAPVVVGKGATLGAGSVIRKDAPAGKLTLSGERQKTIDGWRRRTRERKDQTPSGGE
jgi:bifunctional UDP-N-acetylglucosamine pyrophosphorylase/glucosamine-1-phosphate N-acetyltransferase